MAPSIIHNLTRTSWKLYLSFSMGFSNGVSKAGTDSKHVLISKQHPVGTVACKV